MMNRKHCIVVMYQIMVMGFITVRSVDVTITAQQRKKMNVTLVTFETGKRSKFLEKSALIVQGDLQFTGLFLINKKVMEKVKSKHDIIALGKDGSEVAIFMDTDKKNEHVVNICIYDIYTGNILVRKKYKAKKEFKREDAHIISDIILHELTGQNGFFTTKIAYCKDVSKGKRTIKHVYVADYDGSNALPVVTTSTINIAPRWNRDAKNPLLFYSESTDLNFRLMYVDSEGKRCVASNYNGINMLPSFSSDGKKAVYCASRGDGNCKIYFYEEGNFTCLIHNLGSNIAPVFSKDDKGLFFCSDFPTGKPHIYHYVLDSGLWEPITKGASSFSPHYSHINNKLVYTKRVEGVMQIFIYDVTLKKQRQITFDASHKEECSWSPCGNYILFCQKQYNSSRLAVVSLLTEERIFITSNNDVCTYPAWSPCYKKMIGCSNTLSTH